MRERLIALIDQADEECKHTKACKNCSGYGKGSRCMNYHIADHLLANGVVVLPCKVGQTVWMADNVWCLDDRETWTFHYETKVLEFKVRSISMSCNSKGAWTKKFRICEVRNGKATDHQHDIGFDDFGKTVFLTREDAERALKEGGKG